eukprot:ctg_561.g199
MAERAAVSGAVTYAKILTETECYYMTKSSINIGRASQRSERGPEEVDVPLPERDRTVSWHGAERCDGAEWLAAGAATQPGCVAGRLQHAVVPAAVLETRGVSQETPRLRPVERPAVGSNGVGAGPGEAGRRREPYLAAAGERYAGAAGRTHRQLQGARFVIRRAAAQDIRHASEPAGPRVD